MERKYRFVLTLFDKTLESNQALHAQGTLRSISLRSAISLCHRLSGLESEWFESELENLVCA